MAAKVAKNPKARLPNRETAHYSTLLTYTFLFAELYCCCACSDFGRDNKADVVFLLNTGLEE